MLIKNKKINIVNLGCRVNAFESNAIAHDLKINGSIITDDLNSSDICIINTCCVTSKADAKTRYFINRACKTKKTKLVIVIGCYAQLNEIDNKKVGIVVGTKYKNQIVNLINQYDDKKITKVEPLSKKDSFDEFLNPVFCTTTRAFLKIQDGCDYMCSYCLIPFARGRQRSLNHIKVISLIKSLIKNGYKEIVLTGVNVAGYDDGEWNFYKLLSHMNSMIGNFRIRISSIEPFQINKKIIDLITSNHHRWCQQMHLCIQSANDEVIAKMKRKYTISDFINLCEYARLKNPLISITTDYIVGFPTETIEQFKNSIENLKQIKFCDMHVFPYSQRKNTLASTFKNLVNDKEKHKRFIEINNFKLQMKNNYLNQFIGKQVNVLFEKSSEKNIQIGHSEYFFNIKVRTKKILTNKLLKVSIDEIQNNQLFGHVCN